MNITPPKIKVELVSDGKKSRDLEKDDTQFKSSLDKEYKNLEPCYLYKIWPGNNRFFLNGRIIAGPKQDSTSNTIVWALLLVIGALYFGTAFPYIWKNITTILPIITLCLYVSTLISLVFTSFTNPGIIPRKAIFEINGSVPPPYNGEMNVFNSSEGNENVSRFIDTKMYKFCSTCEVYRPPRASHCK